MCGREVSGLEAALVVLFMAEEQLNEEGLNRSVSNRRSTRYGSSGQYEKQNAFFEH